MAFSPFFNILPQHETLRTIAIMRIAALLCLSLVLALATFWLDIAVRPLPLVTTMALLAAFNAWTWHRMQQSEPVSDREVFIQLLIDIAALSIMLYFSGGATNPFVSFYLPALAVAAALLPWRYAFLLSAIAIAAYSLLTTYFQQLHIGDPDRAISYHLAGMWANFSVSAALITWFVAGLSRTVRQRDAQLAQARERYLENDRLVALGIQAANVAHEIGTPLSTVAIITEEILREVDRVASTPGGQDSALSAYREEFATIEAQISLCKAALDKMGKYGSDGNETEKTFVANAWLTHFVDEWRLRYPATRIEIDLPANDVCIKGVTSVAQILITLLDNAVQAVPHNDTAIRLSLSIKLGNARIDVIDQGPGITPDLLMRLGFEPINNHARGQGIGLFLAFAAARQIGAHIELTSIPGTGTRASLTIPIA